MRILLLGGEGMLGQALEAVLSGQELIVFGEVDLDITDVTAVREKIVEVGPDVIVNAAAYTDVDGAEENLDLAMAVNGEGVKNIALVAKDLGATMVHYSTDYVFSGEAKDGYLEGDSPGPALNAYGESKLAGERFLMEVRPKFFLQRLAWLYGPGGNNFVDTMLRLGGEKSELQVVNDQFGSPTYTFDVAAATLELIQGEWEPGIYHTVNAGQTSWYEFAHKIFQVAEMGHVTVRPVSAKEFGRAAKRPEYSVLKNTRGPQLREWREALQEYVESLKT